MSGEGKRSVGGGERVSGEKVWGLERDLVWRKVPSVVAPSLE